MLNFVECAKGYRALILALIFHLIGFEMRFNRINSTNTKSNRSDGFECFIFKPKAKLHSGGNQSKRIDE